MWRSQPGSDDEKALEESIIHALKRGYRHIDTASVYGVEEVVGRAVRASGVPRSDIIVVTKLWGDKHDDPAGALDKSLESLGMDYVDVYLMHWPWAKTAEHPVLRKWESPTFIETWAKMEALVGERCRAIGVSNFGQKPLEELMAATRIVPAVNQVELHARNPNHKLVAFCQSKGIHVTSWRTLGGPDRQNPLLTHDVFKAIAAAHGVSTGVVSLSWVVQRGVSVIPKSGNPGRIDENLRLVTLSADEMARMDAAEETVGRRRFANFLKNQQFEIDGRTTLQGWTYEDFGWEDENGNWLT
ncbi:Glycerol 2-dehydrogenase (NADP(+)) [Paramyrothecium foliicola]|nr:Glycerol 2-dehydrogenase (NADP(+)) [Paramyrothecium foliicola]